MKMKQSLSLILLSIVLVGLGACGRKVTRIDPNNMGDISGRWNATDSRLVSEEMIDQVNRAPWKAEFIRAKNKKPVVIVGTIFNKSHEHIDAETFCKDLERNFVQKGDIGLVQGGKKREEMRAEKADQQINASQSTMKKFGLENGADFILQGSINSIVDSYKRKKEVYYQVNLELTNIETNEVVWIGDKKIAKFVKN
jgi:uncharacterized protein (TIGR02722 family)